MCCWELAFTLLDKLDEWEGALFFCWELAFTLLDKLAEPLHEACGIAGN